MNLSLVRGRSEEKYLHIVRKYLEGKAVPDHRGENHLYHFLEEAFDRFLKQADVHLTLNLL